MKGASPEKLLTRERRQTLETLDRLREELRSEVEFDGDEYDPDLFEREKTLAAIQILERKLTRVEAALARVQMGQYGFCRDCGQPIDPGRLEVVPEATRCPSCKNKAERGFR